MAKERNIKGYYRMNKVTLYRKLYNYMNEIDRFKLIWCMDDKTIGKNFEIYLKNNITNQKKIGLI